MSTQSILVIDDDRDFAEGLAELLRTIGHEVVVAHSGEEAVGEMAGTFYDAVFMDVMLVGMNGLDAMAAIRNLRPDAKVVLMSGYDISHFAESAQVYGAAATLQKPFGLDSVRQALDLQTGC